MEIILENSLVGDKRANGEVERAIESVQGMARTVKVAVEIAAGCEFPPENPIVAWMVEHSATL